MQSVKDIVNNEIISNGEMEEASKLLVVANDLIVLMFHVSQNFLQPMVETPK